MLSDSRQIARRTAQLVMLARQGDDGAYDRLFALAADRVLLYIRLRLRAPLSRELEALDVLQETYLQAHRSFARFEYRGAGAFSRWLCRIAARMLSGLGDRFGAKKRQAPRNMYRISRVLETVAESGVNPADLASRLEDLGRLDWAALVLPPVASGSSSSPCGSGRASR